MHYMSSTKRGFEHLHEIFKQRSVIAMENNHGIIDLFVA